MALKGSATIELTNADGSKEVIKHDNMITNAVSDFLKSYRGEMAPIMKITKNNDNYMQTLFGGILLFDETLNNDPDDYFLPSLKVTGYASQNAYAGADVARGSHNVSESGLQEDGKSYKFVWDFSTSQGNGTIKSLGLCPNMMGQMGCSATALQTDELKDFALSNDTFSPFNTYGYMLNPNSGSKINNISTYNLGIVAVIDDIAYAMDIDNVRLNNSAASQYIMNNGGVLKLYRFKLGANGIGISDVVGRATYIDCIDVTLPADFISTLFVGSYNVYFSSIASNFDRDNNKLIVFPSYLKQPVAPNGTIKYLEIDLKNNMSISSYTFTNTTPGTIRTSGNVSAPVISNGTYAFLVLKDYILVYSYIGTELKSHLYVVKRSDNTQIKELTYSDGTHPTYTWSDESSTFAYISPIFRNNNILVFARTCNSSISNNNYMYVCDLETGLVARTNSSKFTFCNNLNIGSKIVYMRNGPYLTFAQAINPFVLTTKNNLDSPVVKTASQTMKITYTLTESEGT